MPRLVLGLKSFDQSLVIEVLISVFYVLGGDKGYKFLMPVF